MGPDESADCTGLYKTCNQKTLGFDVSAVPSYNRLPQDLATPVTSNSRSIMGNKTSTPISEYCDTPISSVNGNEWSSLGARPKVSSNTVASIVIKKNDANTVPPMTVKKDKVAPLTVKKNKFAPMTVKKNETSVLVAPVIVRENEWSGSMPGSKV